MMLDSSIAWTIGSLRRRWPACTSMSRLDGPNMSDVSGAGPGAGQLSVDIGNELWLYYFFYRVLSLKRFYLYIFNDAANFQIISSF
jgi:hypothetical protein